MASTARLRGGCFISTANENGNGTIARRTPAVFAKSTLRNRNIVSSNSGALSRSRFSVATRGTTSTTTAVMAPSNTAGRRLQQQRRQQAGPRRPSRSVTGNRVLAFRDAHRAQQLLETASEFVSYWMLGRQEGPTHRVMEGLNLLSASDIRADIHGLIVHTQDTGPDGLARLLSSEHRPAGLSLKHWHNRVCAANEDTDTVFCLMEIRAEDEQGHARSCYQVLKLDLLLDDTSRRVIRVLERGQWDSAGDGLTALLLAPLRAREEEEEAEEEEAEHEKEDEEEEREREAREGDLLGSTGHQHRLQQTRAHQSQDPQQQQQQQHSDRDRPLRTRSTRAGGEVVGNDLPVERIVAQSQVARFIRGFGAERLRDAARAWCVARCSGTDPRAILEPLLAPGFRLWDAYGLLPLVCSISDRAAGQEAAAAAAAYTTGGSAVGAVGAVAPGATLQMGVQVDSSSCSSPVVSGGSSTGDATATGYTMALMMGGGGCVAPREAVFDIIENAKREYDVLVTPIDLAVSYTHNVVFSHWLCKMTPRGAHAATDSRGRPLTIEQECVEVDIFDSDGLLTDAWMFRDALDFEKHMMMSRRQQVAAEEERRRLVRQGRKHLRQQHHHQQHGQ